MRKVYSLVPLLLLLVVLLTSAGYCQATVSVSELKRDSARYDKQVIAVTGTIANYQEKTSARGNAYTTFGLHDGGASLAVFAWKHQGMRNALRVRVTGMFTLVKRVGQYTFYNELEAAQITVLR